MTGFVYRYWDQTEINRQMSARGTVPDIRPMMQDYARHSATMRGALPCELNLPYGPTPAERLDFFPATKPGANHFDLPLRFMDKTAALTRAALRVMQLQT